MIKDQKRKKVEKVNRYCIYYKIFINVAIEAGDRVARWQIFKPKIPIWVNF
jgi:hypothetical protein